MWKCVCVYVCVCVCVYVCVSVCVYVCSSSMFPDSDNFEEKTIWNQALPSNGVRSVFFFFTLTFIFKVKLIISFDRLMYPK